MITATLGAAEMILKVLTTDEGCEDVLRKSSWKQKHLSHYCYGGLWKVEMSSGKRIVVKRKKKKAKREAFEYHV
jgi:hypothetical protein